LTLLLLLLRAAVNMMTLMLSVLDEVVDGMSISFAGVSSLAVIALRASACCSGCYLPHGLVSWPSNAAARWPS
jgi:hypothetical protein